MKKWLKLAKKKQNKDLKAKMLFLSALVLTWELSFPYVVAAEAMESSLANDLSQVKEIIVRVEAQPEKVRVQPQPQPKKVFKVVATAYSSSVEETDNTPCITANGFDVCENNEVNVVAANFLPFGTKIKIPELYGEKFLVVQDRMNARYKTGRIDIWHPSKDEAVHFGVKVLQIEVY
ncbi:MAG: hypothetical protein WCW02_04795 [Candidatus Buchananbacteria bacterium]